MAHDCNLESKLNLGAIKYPALQMAEFCFCFDLVNVLINGNMLPTPSLPPLHSVPSYYLTPHSVHCPNLYKPRLIEESFKVWYCPPSLPI